MNAAGEGTIGLGSTGLIGKGGGGTGSGYGRGAGAGFGGRGTRVPTVRQAKAEVMGSLDKEVIRRVVRAHVGEVRACYEQGLKRDPNLKGRVTLDLRIETSGEVSSASVVEDTLTESSVAACISAAARRWKFPADAPNVATVRYPFVLEPG
ncbi:AgmX/PglI C-terminal domain-containing protein [Nannocystis pusilla]|uniref:AgmX/PglI C-terminal domain-containing protein n=1 Tax=Nannocystis pusilla TaxID=889268 RepID=UPI003B7DB5B9